ncbi:lysosomal amino acid transporter 1 homolog isoform X1 [Paramormyrops kingsleyae]|uniref:Solute carrier family 66 member 1 like n=1 Tax=Paramormyrops kingsleyae TaxID=1676925 RepID=A0A3B3QU29_9TELE|nr:putative uncharacterized protein PQLC2L isoform X1 [Paramormyrops kingsleyae]XP_023648428.1 putative uncharacterized protein PQLC2L isoform X1 [Paramormyrops kingsleyae]
MPDLGADMASADVASNLSSVLDKPPCVNGTPWIRYLFEECADSAWEYCSVVIGLISMLCFLLSTLPQVYESYRNGRVEEAISLGFLLFILSGDISNFAGCYLTRQLPVQTVTAVFYIFTDIILISQYVYYKIKNKRNHGKRKSHLKWMCFMWCGGAFTLCVMLPKILDESGLGSGAGKTSHSLEMSGYACGYLSSVFYLSSRIPQIHKNYKRQSTEGTSYLLFALAMMGNCTYGLSLIVVLPALKRSKSTFILNHLAWLIGSLGVLLLDLFISIQFVLYRKKGSGCSSQLGLKNFPEVEPLLSENEEL